MKAFGDGLNGYGQRRSTMEPLAADLAVRPAGCRVEDLYPLNGGDRFGYERVEEPQLSVDGLAGTLAQHGPSEVEHTLVFEAVK